MKIILKIYIIATILGFSPGLYSTTIRTIGIEEMIELAELVFQGEVIRAENIVEGPLVYTMVKFRIEEIWKGQYEQEFIDLRFLGGESHGLRTVVVDQALPSTNTRGVFFVENIEQHAVNPMVGWHQGQFRISIVNDEEILSRYAHVTAVSHMEIADYKQQLLKSKTRDSDLLRSIREAGTKPLTVQDLKRQVTDFITNE